jgi:hypothetical protein
MKIEKETDIEKACKKLISVDNYVRIQLLNGVKVTGTAVRNKIVAIKNGSMTTEKAGFIPHRIADKWLLEPLK